MHHKLIDGIAFNHNGDYSGDVHIVVGDTILIVPFSALKEFVAGYVRDTRISALEDASADSLLGIAVSANN